MNEALDSSEKDYSVQLSFARHNFDNLQSLIRASDTKAAAFMTLVLFLAGTAIPLIKDAMPRLHAHPLGQLVVTLAYLLTITSFVLCFTRVVALLYATVRPRGARFYKSPDKSTDLMWQDHVLRHEDSAAYFEALRNSSAEIVLRNLTDQIFELAHISKEKMDSLRDSRKTLWAGFWLWLIMAAMGLFLARH